MWLWRCGHTGVLMFLIVAAWPILRPRFADALPDGSRRVDHHAAPCQCAHCAARKLRHAISGGLRTTLNALGAGYLAAGHEAVLVVPGARDSEELTPAGRVVSVKGIPVPWLGGYRVLLGRRRLARLLASLEPDHVEVSDQVTLR